MSGRFLDAYRWHRGRCAAPLRFEASREGLERFSTYVAERPPDPIHVLVDLVEEEFREDSVPRVIGPDRRALIQARRRRLFRDPTWGCSLVRGRDRNGRREDRWLFTALTRPEKLTPWVEAIARNRIPLAGVWSLPLLTERLLKPIPVGASPALIVSWQHAGGLRQTLIVDGKLKLSRLAVPPLLEDGERALYVLSEVEKLQRYLARHHLLESEDALSVYIIANSTLEEAILRLAPASSDTRYRLVSLSELGRRVGIEDAQELVWCDRLFIALLTRRVPHQQYAPARVIRNYALHRVRAGLGKASLVVVIAGLFGGASGLTAGFSAGRLAESLATQAVLYRHRYDEARKRLPAAPVELPAMQFAVETAEGLQEARTSPRAALLALSQTLDRHAGVRLESIAWSAEADTARALRSGGSPPPATESLVGARSLHSGPVRYQSAEIRGRIEPFDGNFRRALEQVGKLAESLRALPGAMEVEVLSLPLDITSEASLRGDAGARAGVTEAPFALRLLWSPLHRVSLDVARAGVGNEFRGSTGETPP